MHENWKRTNAAARGRSACLLSLAVLVAAGRVRAAEPGTAAAPLRLAVLAEPGSRDGAALAELVSVGLSGRPEVALVERAELERLLKEQALSAAGLTDLRSRVQLGKLLGADGYVFLQPAEHRPVLYARLVEARGGLTAWQGVYATENSPLQALASNICAQVPLQLGKLSASPTPRVLASVVRLFNATTRPECAWVEEDLPDVLAACLSQDPRVLVVERRQLGALLTEKDLVAGVASDFLKAGVVVDGELGLQTAENIVGTSVPVRLTLRLRDAALAETARFAVTGELARVEELVVRAAAEAAHRFAGAPPPAPAQRSAEARAFLELAQERGLVWAAETAHALDTKDPKALRALVATLLTDVSGSTLERAKRVARAAEISRSTGAGRDLFLFSEAKPVTEFLKRTALLGDREVLEIVRPARQLARCQVEQADLRHYNMQFLADRVLPACFDSPEEQVAYMEAWTYRLLQDERLPEGDRLYSAMVLLQSAPFDRTVYRNLLKHAPPAARYVCWARLHELSNDPVERRACAAEALRAAPAVVAQPRLHGRLTTDGDRWFAKSLREFAEQRPELKDELGRAFQGIVDEGVRTNGFVDAAYVIRLASSMGLLPPRSVVDFVDRFEKSMDPASPLMRGPFFRDLAACREKARAALGAAAPAPPVGAGPAAGPVAGPAAPPPAVRAWNLLTADSESLRAPAGLWARRGRAGDTPFTAQRLLLDGRTLWVGFGLETIESGRWLHMVGLAQLDLESGKVRSFHFGRVPGGHGQGGGNPQVQRGNVKEPDLYAVVLTPMCRWGDAVCVGMGGVGVLVFPVENPAGSQSLAGVQHLCSTNGLLDQEVWSIRGVGDNLYVASRSALAVWNRARGETRMVATTAGRVEASPLAGKGAIMALVEGRTTNEVVALLATEKSDVETWAYDTGSGAWAGREVHALPRDTETGLASLYLGALLKMNTMGADGRHWLLHSRATIHAAWDGSQGAFADRAAFPAARYPFPADFVPDYDFIDYEGGCITITGFGDDWAVKYFSTNAVLPGKLSWAAADTGRRPRRPQPAAPLYEPPQSDEEPLR